MKINMKGKNAELYLYESIGGYFGISSDEFIKEVKALGNIDTITLHINSDGGSVFDGIAIYNYLLNHNAKVHVEVDSLAASIASIIAMAGDSIKMAEGSFLMIHNPWTMTGGTAAELRKAADTMDLVRDAMLDVYMKRATVSREDISDKLDDETWITSAMAVELGFADEVTAPLEMAACLDKAKFKHAPEALVAIKPEEIVIPEDSNKPRMASIQDKIAKMNIRSQN